MTEVDREPRNLRTEIIRSPHRSVTFAMYFDISGLIDENGHPLVRGEALEEILYNWCRRGVQESLDKGRAKVKNHP